MSLQNFFIDYLPEYDKFKEYCELKINDSTDKVKTYNIILTRCSFFELSKAKIFIDYSIENGGNGCFVSNIDDTKLGFLFSQSERYLDPMINFTNLQQYLSKIKNKTYIYICYNIRVQHLEVNLKIINNKFNISLQDLIDYPDLYDKFKGYLHNLPMKEIKVEDLLQIYKNKKEQSEIDYEFNVMTDIWLQEKDDKLILK